MKTSGSVSDAAVNLFASGPFETAEFHTEEFSLNSFHQNDSTKKAFILVEIRPRRTIDVSQFCGRQLASLSQSRMLRRAEEYHQAID